MPHDSAPAPEPVLMQLTVPGKNAAPTLLDGLVRPIGAVPAAAVLEPTADDEAVSEFLVRIAHGDTGFVARTDSGPRALALVAATVAALCGEDIRAALTSPDIEFVKGLKPPAVEALRGVLVAVETNDPDAVHAALAVLAD
ncbi:hypothetical protein [Nocardia crassostreae]|uniref:hypothetical protein n=1 Tax=Nocardia crassostreae TaxID=53428 RepID=UPI000832A438|nr:hypothetical protein [Nocardia crassostreae]